MTYKMVAVVSGGLDSMTMMLKATEDLNLEFKDIHAISFNYGQRHVQEIAFARALCDYLGVQHDIIDLSSLTALLAPSGSSLVSDEPVPEGHYAADNMKSTVVPNRNMIMYSIAAGIAVADGARVLGVGVHGGDHFVYPDCRPSFIFSLERTIQLATQGFIHPQFMIYDPFTQKDKNFIAQEAYRLEQDLGLSFIMNTWSCYKGGQVHCGKCGTCVERAEALHSVPGYFDPTEYEDNEFWKTATQSQEVPD